MPAPYRHISAAELMGSWPVVPHPVDGYSKPYLLTGTIMETAKVLGMRRAPSGFDVHNKSLAVYVDGAFNQVDFDDYGPGLYSLAQVVSNINADVVATVAHEDNGFLLLKSTTYGQGSSIKVMSITGYEELPAELGLLSGVEALAGDLENASHLDPTRQVATPGQLAPMWGEPITADHFNRVAIQLAISADDAHNLFHIKRTAQKRIYETTLAGVPSFQLATSDLVYMGPDAIPTVAQLEDVIAILDENDDEIVVESENIADTASGTVTFTREGWTSSQLCTFNGISPFQNTDPAGDWYVRVDTIGGVGAALDGVLLKILEYRNASTVVVHPVVPSTGEIIRFNLTTGSTTQERVQVITGTARVEGLYSDVGLTQRAEQVNQARQGPIAVTRIERNNRIFCATGDFVAQGVIAGDLVDWDAAGPSSPYSNEAVYRVSQVVDAQTLELTAEDYGPAFLNAIGPVHGNVTITSDGDFLSQPYVKFENPDVVPNGNVRIVYLGSSTLKEATDDVATFAGSVRYAQEAEARLQKAVIGLAGPSMDSLSDVLNWVYGDRRNNLENTIVRLSKEHYNDDDQGGGGRHQDIRPDSIDMFPETPGSTVVIRSATGEDYSDPKLILRLPSAVIAMSIGADGTVTIGENALAQSSADLFIQRANNAAIKVQGLGGNAAVWLYGDDGDAQLRMESGTGTWNDVHIDMITDGDEWNILVDQSQRRFSIDNDDHSDIIAISWDADIGINGNPVSGKTVTMYGNGSDEDILSLIGNGDWVRAQLHPNFGGGIVGTIEAFNDSITQHLNVSADMGTLRLSAASFIELYTNSQKRWQVNGSNGDLVPVAAEGIGGGSIGTTQPEYIYTKELRSAINDLEIKVGTSTAQWLFQPVSTGGKLLSPTNRQIGDTAGNHVSAMYALYYGGPSAQDVTYSSAQDLVFKTGSIFGSTRWTIQGSDGSLLPGASVNIGEVGKRVDTVYADGLRYDDTYGVHALEVVAEGIRIPRGLVVGGTTTPEPLKVHVGADGTVQMVLHKPSGSDAYIHMSEDRGQYLRLRSTDADDVQMVLSSGDGAGGALETLEIYAGGTNFIRPVNTAVDVMNLGDNSHKFNDLYLNGSVFADVNIYAEEGWFDEVATLGPGSTAHSYGRTGQNCVFARAKINCTALLTYSVATPHWNVQGGAVHTVNGTGDIVVALDIEPDLNNVVLVCGSGGPLSASGYVFNDGGTHRVRILMYNLAGALADPVGQNLNMVVIGRPL